MVLVPCRAVVERLSVFTIVGVSAVSGGRRMSLRTSLYLVLVPCRAVVERLPPYFSVVSAVSGGRRTSPRTSL